MYRPSRGKAGIPWWVLLALGGIIGAFFFVYDNYPRSSTVQVALRPTETPSLTVTLSPTPVVTPARPMRNALTSNLPSADATLFIPTAGINAPVITTFLHGGTWDVTHLGSKVGYLQGTAWIGNPGNIVLSGHVEMANGSAGIFASLDELSTGDPLILSEGALEYRYVVKEMKHVAPDDLSVVYPTQADMLTLITCSDYNFLRNRYDQRLVVVAERIS